MLLNESLNIKTVAMKFKVNFFYFLLLKFLNTLDLKFNFN